MSHDKADDDDLAPPSQKKVEAFLGTLRQSAQIAHELLRTTARQEEHIRSLEDELTSARARVGFLEQETGQLRDRLTAGVPDHPRLAELEELMDEQNCLAQLLVTTDRLGRVQSTREGLQIAVEVFHNLVGVMRYGIYVVDEAGRPMLIAPNDPREREGIAAMDALVTQTLATGKVSRLEGTKSNGVPACYPLRLGRSTVGAMAILELLPHLGGTVGRLQDDLLGLLGERLIDSMCLGALHHQASREDLWPSVRAACPRVPLEAK
jgi:hypothetical protein